MPRPMAAAAIAALLLLPLLPGPALAEAEAAPPLIDREAAARWLAGARWTSLGLYADTPDHVVFPKESHFIIGAFRDADALPRIDALAAAHAAARLQDPVTGGFRAFADQPLWIFVEDTRYAVDLALDHGVPINGSAAAAFLLAHRFDDGGFAPRVNRPPSAEATANAVHALARLGQLNEAIASTAVSFLQATQLADGGWSFTGDPRETTSGSIGTYHAVTALDELGALGGTTAERAAQFLLSLERPIPGGFREYAGGPGLCTEAYCPSIEEVTVGSTTRALLALRTLGRLADVKVPTVHAQWIADRQVTEGPFAGAFDWYDNYAPPATDYALSTPLALTALRVLGETRLADTEAALRYLDAAQHDGTGGFGWWQGYQASLQDTEAALRALRLLRASAEIPADPLAATLSGLQETDGALKELHWRYDSRLDHTATGVLALAHAGRLNAIDREAAASFLDSKEDPEGGFLDPLAFGPTPRATLLAVKALDALGQIGRVDAAATIDYLASLQKSDGRVSDEYAFLHESLRDTRAALEVLARFGGLDRIDQEKTAAFIAGRQNPAGGWADLMEAHHAVAALVILGRLDLVDSADAIAYVMSFRTPRGAFADEGFHPIGSAVERHAAALETLALLGALTFPAIPPTFVPLGDVTAKTGKLVTITVRAAHPEGEAIAYALASALPAGATFTPGASNAQFRWTPPHAAVGDYLLAFTATSASGGTATQTITLHVTDGTVAPNAAFTLPAFARRAQTLTLADGSSDPDGGDILAREWHFQDGSPTASGASAQHAWFTDGMHTVSLTVTDDEEQTATTTRTVTVDGIAPTATARPVPGEATKLTLGATDDRSGVASLNYRINGGTTLRATANTTLTLPGDGTHTVEYWAVDRAGNQADPQTYRITVDTAAPQVTLVSPRDRSTTAEVKFEAVANDVGSGIRLVEFYLDGKSIAQFRHGGKLTHTRVVGTGFHTFRVVATDWVGKTTEREQEFLEVWLQ